MSTTTSLSICALAAAVFAAAPALAQPSFGNPSPTAGSSTSQQANAAADTAAYQEVSYTNKDKRGPALVVIPGHDYEYLRNHAFAGLRDLTPAATPQDPLASGRDF